MGQTQSSTSRAVSAICNDQSALDADPNLATLCSCQTATESLNTAVAAYEASLAKFDADTEEYRKYEAYEACRTQGSCTNYDTIYNTTYQAQYNSFKDESLQWKNIVGKPQFNDNDTSVYCRNDWGNDWYTADTGLGKYNASNNPNYYGGLCKRKSEVIKIKWSDQFAGNAVRPTVNTAPTNPGNFNNATAIACCSLTISKLSAGEININDVSQNCTAEVNQKYDKYQTDGIPPDITAPPPTEGEVPKEEGLPIYAIVLISMAVFMVLAGVIWAGIHYKKRSQKKVA